jgi:hypothetical protein
VDKVVPEALAVVTLRQTNPDHLDFCFRRMLESDIILKMISAFRQSSKVAKQKRKEEN